MRKNHSHYIDAVNEMTSPFYIKVGKNRWRTTDDVMFSHPTKVHTVRSGTEWDMFSCVPNTGYIEFHKSSLGHDIERKQLPRYQADYNFSWDMHHRIEIIRRRLQSTDCPQAVIDKEIVRLTRIASLYTIGVSGKLGSLYIWLDKVT